MNQQNRNQMKKFINAPLPFQGQKRRFVKQIEEMANGQKKGTVFIDLFGGSGLVSHTIKQARPDCRVVYNDFDHYSERLSNIGRTNAMLCALRPIVASVPPKQRIDEPVRSQVIAEVERWHKTGFVDWFSLSSNLLFTMWCAVGSADNYVHCFEEFRKETLYNRLRKDDYNADGYLEGVEVVSMDWYAVGSADNPDYLTNTDLFLMWSLSSTRPICPPTAAHTPRPTIGVCPTTSTC